MLFPVVTPGRVFFIMLMIGFAMMHITGRNVTQLKAPPVKAALFAFAETLLQAVILLGTLVILNTIALALFGPGTLVGWAVLILTVVLAMRPVKQVTAFMERQLTK